MMLNQELGHPSNQWFRISLEIEKQTTVANYFPRAWTSFKSVIQNFLGIKKETTDKYLDTYIWDSTM